VVSKGLRPETQAVPKGLARLFRKAKRPEDRCLNTSSLRGVRDHRIIGGSRSSPSTSRLTPKGFEARIEQNRSPSTHHQRPEIQRISAADRWPPFLSELSPKGIPLPSASSSEVESHFDLCGIRRRTQRVFLRSQHHHQNLPETQIRSGSEHPKSSSGIIARITYGSGFSNSST
jgi:hypothetical protein